MKTSIFKKMAFALLFVLMFSSMSFATGGDLGGGTYDGSSSKPYQISDAADLKTFASKVNGGETTAYAVLTRDIDMNQGKTVLDGNGDLYNNGEGLETWTPIGTSEKPYTGTFDGNGHTIRGLYFNDESTEYVGLFGYIEGTAKVQNVGVVDSYFKGYQYVGGVVAYNFYGTVSNAYNTGSVNGNEDVGGVVAYNFYGTVSNAYNTGSVNGNEDVGGVVAYNFYGTVSNAYNTGSVNGNEDVGGVAGYNYHGTVSNAYNTGSVSGYFDVGGVAGYNYLGAVISNAYNAGAVNGEWYVGGVVGENSNGTVSNVYNTGAVSGKTYVGGVVGYNYGTVSNGFFNTTYYSGNAIGESEGTADNVKGLSMTDLANLTVGNGGDFPLLKGETESPWAKGIYYDKATGKLANSELPYLKSLPKPQDVEMEFNVKDNVIQISSTDDLKNFAKLVNEYHITDVDAELTTNLTVNSNLLGENNANVDAETGEYKGNAPANVWTPIGTDEKPYKGTFDGNGHTIRGLYFNDENTNYVGLFGYIYGSNAIVQNVGVVDSYLKGYLMVGGVVGYNAGGTVSNVYNTGSVSGDLDVGGVVGGNDGTVSNVYNTGYVSGTNEVGGVVGYNDGTVSNVYNTGYVSGTNEVGGVVGFNLGTVSNVYNTGSVSGKTYVGGVVGYNAGGTVSNVYNTGSVSGDSEVGGVVGYNDGTVSNGFFNTAYYSGNAIGGGSGTANTVVGKTSTELANLTVGNGGDFPLLEGETVSPFLTGSVDVNNAVCKFPYLQVFGEASQPQFNVVFITITNIDGGAELGVVAVNPNSKISLADVQVMENGEILSLYKDVEGVPTEWNFENDVVTENVTLKAKYIGVLDGVYQIASAQDLMFFASIVNGGTTTASAALTQDICLNACDENESVLKADGTLSDDASNFAQWTPIGTDEHPYTGTFDGNGYTIRGLYFNDESTEYVGLFGYIDESAIVQNVGVVDSYLKGYQYVGGVVGKNDNGIVSNVYNTGSVSGNGVSVGGVVGYNGNGTVSNVYNTGTVSGTNYDVGGVVGYNGNGTVSNVYNTGSVSGASYVGGVVGFNYYGTVSNVYNTGSVSGDSEVGGVVGGMDGGDINKAYYDNQTCNNCNSYGTGKPLAELATLTIGSKADDDADFPLLDGETENPWANDISYDKATGKLTSTLPYLKNFPVVPDAETILSFTVASGVIQISTAEDLKNFAKLVNEYDIRDVDAELTTNLTVNSNLLGENNANVDAETGEYKGTAPANVWTPIGTMDNQYTGKFDGKGYTVSGLYFNNESAECVGLFGAIGEYSKVQNVGVVDSYLRGKANVGGVVGYSYVGFVGNVYSTGFVSGSESVGGVVGCNYGGFVGNVYSTGFVSGSESVGGVVGYIFDGGVENAYYNKDVFNGNAIGDALAFDWDEGGFGEPKDFEVPENVKGATSAEFTDGTVAMLLHDWCEMDGETCKEGGLNGSIWGQDLAAENSLPDFSGVVGFKYGSITFFNLNDDVADSASIDATAKAPVSITSDIVVTGPITFKRPFAVGYSTMMLPFSVNAENKPAELEFYSFDKVEENNGKYTASYNPVNASSGLNAHTPYIVKNSGKDALSQVTFEGEFTLGTSVMPPPNSSSSAWKFNGTYEYKTWEEGDAGLGSTYGFAGSTGNDPDIVGKFAKVGAGAYIYPMRAYLEYTAPAPAGRPAANGVAANTVASLPDEIDVVIVDKDETSGEETTRVIGTINTRTGEFKFANDRWFDLQGRYLGNKKPSQKGAYYNNGKKVIVK